MMRGVRMVTTRSRKGVLAATTMQMRARTRGRETETRTPRLFPPSSAALLSLPLSLPSEPASEAGVRERCG
ncbi:hypothetical protein VUR80DRAFT_10354 [Thermomyces stellatus]